MIQPNTESFAAPTKPNSSSAGMSQAPKRSSLTWVTWRTVFPSLVVANTSAIKDWASREGVSLASDPDKMLEDSKVRDLFKAEIAKYGEKFKGFEAVQDFALIAEDFTADNGLLTPSLKVKRRAVFERHGHLIDALYKKRAAAKAQTASA